MAGFTPDDAWILHHRGPKSHVDPREPYLYFAEKERTASGDIEDVLSVFLTNSECPYKCLMCDLWKNTLDRGSAPGDIPYQIKKALKQLATGRQIKLYNSGNFFDRRAIPVEDYEAIAGLVQGFERVIVECHPKLVGSGVLDFDELLQAKLEIAMGLETVHPGVLKKLNKRMTLDDFAGASKKLRDHDISIRAFILLRPPFLSEQEGVMWARRSIEYAFDHGVECCVVIPTRIGNGALEQLRRQGSFDQPTIQSLEEVLEYGISLGRGRVFADLWDIEKFSACGDCIDERKERINKMNLHQSILPKVTCGCSH